MTQIAGGHTAPRDGSYKLADGGHITLEDKRIYFAVPLKAGEKFPGGADRLFEVHELRPGEVVPKDGVWMHMPDGKVTALKEGEKFPDAEGGDYVWAREIDPDWGKDYKP